MEKKREIEVKYRKRDRNSSEMTDNEVMSPEELRSEIMEKYRKGIRIASIFTAILSLFILLAIISHSPKDEFVFDFTLKDYLEAIKGNSQVLSKLKEISNWLGPIGALVSNFFINKTFGYFSIVIPILLILWSIKLLITQNFSGQLVKWTIFILLFSLFFSSFLSSLNLLVNLNIPYYFIGLIGTFLATLTSNFIGVFGAFIFYFFAVLVTLVFALNINVEKHLLNSYEKFKSIFQTKKVPESKFEEKEKEIVEMPNYDNSKTLVDEQNSNDFEIASILAKSFEEINNEEKDYTQIVIGKTEFVGREPFDLTPETESKFTEEEHYSDTTLEEFETNSSEMTTEKKLTVVVEEPPEVERDFKENKTNLFTPLSTLVLDEKINFKPPPVDLLIDDESKFQINEEELKQNARLLQEKLETFKIYIENLTVTPGPVVTQYEFVPAPGIKLSRIQSLADDIALGLKAKGIRIIAPVPGKGTVGIEIPNRKPLVVRFGNCLKNAKINQNYRLPIILGKTISGEVFVEDLARMPHLLIAGATGSGKSVGINTIIASLIYKMHPQNLKFVIIDPKKVELTHYQQLLYHYLAVSPELDDAIVTEPSDAVLILKALVAEMQSRYDVLYSVQQKNIAEYNKKVREGLFKNDQEFVHRPMPYIVTIIDELADLMLTTGKEIEGLIIRLAQLARAVGIHLVVATQRPSVDIIIGLIKANFPARISYLVASRVDSRTIIDTIGAEQLLGNGDMLFLPNGSPHPIRIQNAFLTTEEIEKICEYIGKQKGYSKPYYLPKVEDNKTSRDGFEREGFDPLFEDAARLIIRYRQASVSMLQRRLKIGYNRAGRIMDELEMAGIVGPFDGSKGRDIRFSSEEELNKFLKEKGIF